MQNRKTFVKKYLLPVGSDRRRIIVKLYQVFLKDKLKYFKINKKEIKIPLEKSRGKYFNELPPESFWRCEQVGKRILVIPSSYPTAKAPLVGTFFQDQSNVMIPDFDMRILFGQPMELVNGDGFMYSESDILTHPDGLSFYYDYDPKDTESNNFERMLGAYEVILGEIIQKGWRPDIIHAQSSVYGGIVADYLGKKFNVPTMLCENMMFLLHNFSKFLQNKIFEAFEGATKVVPPSTDKMRTILMHGIKCDPVVIGNMVDDDLFKISSNDGKCENDLFEILIVAGSSYIKDLPTFFNAIKEIINKGQLDIHATIIGNDVWGDQNYFQYVKKIGIEGYCTFVGSVARAEMPKYYQASNVFVSSSIAEGFQVSILEAMACGKPVVTTSHGGAEDNMRPENGIVVGIRDYKAIADALIKIKKQEIKFDSRIIRQTVVEKYGKVAFKKKIADIYNDVIEGK